MGGETHAAISTLRTNTNLSLPKRILQLPSGSARHGKSGNCSGQARIGRGGKTDFGQMRQCFPKATGQHRIPALDALHSDTVHESQGRAEPVDYWQAARAVLHKAVRAGRLVVEAGAGESGPNARLNFFPNIKQAGAFGSEQPFVRARQVRVATESFYVHADLSHRLRAVHNG